MPQRIADDVRECRVVFFAERSGRRTEFDLSALPVSTDMRRWLAEAFAAATGPSGSYRTWSSACSLQSAIRTFAQYLDTLERPPASPSHLRGVHWDGFVLTLGRGRLRTVVTSMRAVFRYAHCVPEEFWGQVNRTFVPSAAQKIPAYSVPEFRRISAAARSHLRGTVQRIAEGRALLARWQVGEIDRSVEPDEWDHGWLLDHIDRHDDVPRYPSGAKHQKATTHGGTAALFAELYPTCIDLGAAAVLLVCLTGHNLSAIENLSVRHQRPDGDAGDYRTALVEMIKPRRGGTHAHMTIALQDVVDGRRAAKAGLRTPFEVYATLVDLCGPARNRAHADALFASFTPKGGRGFEGGLPRGVVGDWSAVTGVLSDTVDEGGRHVPLVVDSRRLRMNWLELHQRPAGHSEQTLANEYLARHRGNLVEYQRIVAKTLDEQVRAAREGSVMRILTAEDIERAQSEPEAVAAEHGLDPSLLTELLAGRLDTVLGGCIDNTHSPHAPAGDPCRASFLMCLSCPCARVIPTHLPVLAQVHDMLMNKANEMTPLRWAQRFAAPVAQLAELLERFPPATVAAAREQLTSAQRELVDRFVTRGLDLP
ncbi:hypothetical protein [Prescottella equi]